MPRYDTVANIVNRAGKELGLWTATIASPYTSGDANVLQMLQLLTSCGQDLSTDHQWPQLRIDGTITGDGSTTTFAVPAGYHEMVAQSVWNRTTRLPVLGPVTPQIWEEFKARQVVGTVYAIFRIVHDVNATIADEFEFLNAPANQNSIRYQYRSRYWVQTSAGTSPTLDEPTASTDRVALDPLLMIRALKLAWRREKGFDTTAAEQDYQSTLAKTLANLSSAPVLHIAGDFAGEHLIDVRNIPDTGWGA